MDNFWMWREVDVFDVEYIEMCVDSSVRMAYDYDEGMMVLTGWLRFGVDQQDAHKAQCMKEFHRGIVSRPAIADADGLRCTAYPLVADGGRTRGHSDTPVRGSIHSLTLYYNHTGDDEPRLPFETRFSGRVPLDSSVGDSGACLQWASSVLQHNMRCILDEIICAIGITWEDIRYRQVLLSADMVRCSQRLEYRMAGCQSVCVMADINRYPNTALLKLRVGFAAANISELRSVVRRVHCSREHTFMGVRIILETHPRFYMAYLERGFSVADEDSSINVALTSYSADLITSAIMSKVNDIGDSEQQRMLAIKETIREVVLFFNKIIYT